MKSYFFRVELEQDDDGRWSSVIPALPGCAAWGMTRDEALEAVREAAELYIEILIEDGREVPPGAESTVIEGLGVAVSIGLESMALQYASRA